MPTTINSLHEEARGALAKVKENHCPFGCTMEQLDDYGYCFHLMGFTNDGKTFEPVAKLYRHNADGMPFDTGFKTVTGKRDCLPSDKLVNPEREQLDQGVIHIAKRWVSDRVYRDIKAPPAEVMPPPVVVSEEQAMKQKERQLERAVADKRRKARVAALEKELAGKPLTEQEQALLTSPAQ